MKIMFWAEVIMSILCVLLFIYDLIEHNYVVVNVLMAISLGLEVYGD